MTDRIFIRGKEIVSRDDFYKSLCSQLGEERLIGSSLDALHDVLTSLTHHTVIEISEEEVLREALGDYWKKILWMLNDSLDENRDLELEIK